MKTTTKESLSVFGQEALQLRIYEVLLVATGFVGGLLVGLLVLGLR
jgi:hypothetical protein